MQTLLNGNSVCRVGRTPPRRGYDTVDRVAVFGNPVHRGKAGFLTRVAQFAGMGGTSPSPAACWVGDQTTPRYPINAAPPTMISGLVLVKTKISVQTPVSR